MGHGRWFVVFLAVAACAGDAARSAPAGAYELGCFPSNTATAGMVHCIRTDTRNGEVQRVNVLALPTSNGPTASVAGAPGRYQTRCAAASTSTQSDFICVRLDTQTGEMLAINLQKVATIPAAAK